MRIILDFVESDIFYYKQGCYLHCPDTNQEKVIESSNRYSIDRRNEFVNEITMFIYANLDFVTNKGFTNIDNYIEK